MKYKILLICLLILAVVFNLILFKENNRKAKIIDELKVVVNNKEKIEKVEEGKEDNNVEDVLEYNHNAPDKLKLTSAYGDNQALHPKVLNFKEKWNGYKYWMVFSPYPYLDDAKENPHIKVSNDLINWEEPKGLKNPLVGKPYNHSPGIIYNSDPHLVYNYDTDTLECYYRYVNDALDKVILYRLTTKDGIHWTDKEEMLVYKRSVKDFLSPSIIYEDGMYKMWAVDKNQVLKYRESKDGYKYENERVIKLNYPVSVLKPWHLDVIKTEKGYEMIIVAFPARKDSSTMNLYYFSSKDNISYTKGECILKPSNISWDNKGIYRSSLIYEDGIYYLYYSGISKDGLRGTGLSYGKDINNLKGYNPKDGKL